MFIIVSKMASTYHLTFAILSENQTLQSITCICYKKLNTRFFTTQKLVKIENKNVTAWLA